MIRRLDGEGMISSIICWSHDYSFGLSSTSLIFMENYCVVYFSPFPLYTTTNNTKTNPPYRIPPHLELNPVPGKPGRKQNCTGLSHSFLDSWRSALCYQLRTPKHTMALTFLSDIRFPQNPTSKWQLAPCFESYTVFTFKI